MSFLSSRVENILRGLHRSIGIAIDLQIYSMQKKKLNVACKQKLFNLSQWEANGLLPVISAEYSPSA